MGTAPWMVLAIKPPWPYFIVNGWKDIENRDWSTKFRGRVLIHASKVPDDLEGDFDFCRRTVMHSGGAVPTGALDEIKRTRGGIVGMATVADCVTASESPWFFGKYGFVLRDGEPLPFMPMRGMLSFFAAPPEITARLAELGIKR